MAWIPPLPPEYPYIPGIFFLSAVAAAVYRASKLYPPLIPIFIVLLLLISMNFEKISIKIPKIFNPLRGPPSATYIIAISIASVIDGLVCDTMLSPEGEGVWVFHLFLFHSALMDFELRRLRVEVQKKKRRRKIMTWRNQLNHKLLTAVPHQLTTTTDHLRHAANITTAIAFQHLLAGQFRVQTTPLLLKSYQNSLPIQIKLQPQRRIPRPRIPPPTVLLTKLSLWQNYYSYK